MNELLRVFAHKVAQAVSSKFAFLVALLVVIVWAALGPHFRYSDTWQLVINTGTTIVTFLMVFIIQYTQGRDTRAIQLKLDELIHSIKEARDSLVDVEEQSDETLDHLQKEFENMRSGSSAAGTADGLSRKGGGA